MNSSEGKRILATLLITSTLIACGGGGGGSGGGGNNNDDINEPTRDVNQPLTQLPLFLQSATENCEFIEAGEVVELVEYRGNLSNVTSLMCSGTKIENLAGIGQLENLVELSLHRTLTNDFSELLSFSGQLRSLELKEIGIESLAAISDLTSLTHLNLSGSTIEDISPLSGLVNLAYLDLSYNRVESITPIESLSNLEKLVLIGNNNIDCSEAISFASILESNGITDPVDLPYTCSSTLIINSSSPSEIVLDPMIAADQFDHLFIIGSSIEDISLTKLGLNLILTVNKENEATEITFIDWFSTGYWHLFSRFEFSDNTNYTRLEMERAVALAEQLPDSGGRYKFNNAPDIVYGGSSTDIIDGDAHPDKLYGEGGDDALIGGAGADLLVGGPGNDILIGNTHPLVRDDLSVTLGRSTDNEIDTYVFSLGDDHDTIYENEGRPEARGILQFTAPITPESLSFSQVDEALVITIDAANSVTIKEWFKSGDSSKLNFFHFDETGPIPATRFVDEYFANFP